MCAIVIHNLLNFKSNKLTYLLDKYYVCMYCVLIVKILVSV